MRGITIIFLLAIFSGGVLAGWRLLSRAPQPVPVAPTVSTAAPAAANPTESSLAPAILARAKAASVFIQVRSVSYLDEKDEMNSSGSGFLLSADGRIATNWHVIASQREWHGLHLPCRTDRVEVILRPGTPQQRLYQAKVLAAHPEDDLALLKISVNSGDTILNCQSIKYGVPGIPGILELGDSNALLETMPLVGARLSAGQGLFRAPTRAGTQHQPRLCFVAAP